MSEGSAETRVAIVGGGAAAFFAALACAEANRKQEIHIFERNAHFLGKVRISGGGRCNVTHASFDPRAMAENYPRGERQLIPLLHRFSPNDTLAWFAQRRVDLKTEADGRMFPISDSSQTIIDCFLEEAQRLGVHIHARTGVESICPLEPGGFELTLAGAEKFCCRTVLIASGGCRAPGSVRLIESLGHRVVAPVPSLFTFQVDAAWLRGLAGVSVPRAEIAVSGTKLRETGPLLVTHAGLSGPVVLRLSAWGARSLHDLNYSFPLLINWLPEFSGDQLRQELRRLRETHPNRLVTNSSPDNLPARLWSELVQQSGIGPETRWNRVTREQMNSLGENLSRTKLHVSGKSLNKDEFVTCGGVDLREVNLRTMESRLRPGLFFAGEVIDVDGITGGFNFQAAWTTGWIAGKAMAQVDETDRKN